MADKSLQALDNNLATSPSTTGPDGLHETTIEALKDTQEELFLLRHYSECIAPWCASS